MQDAGQEKRNTSPGKQFHTQLMKKYIGTWDWIVEEDLLIACPKLADLFNIPVEEAAKGTSIQRFLARIHHEDRPTVQESVDQAVQTGAEYTASFRVLNNRGSWCSVFARGQCTTPHVRPRHFSGVVLWDEKDASPTRPHGTSLTPREIQCLYWCSQGKTTWEVGQILALSDRTVEHYINSATKKLDCSTRIQTVALAIRLGLIE